VFEEQQERNQTIVSSEVDTLSISDISKYITRKAIWMNEFYKFDNLQKYL
jgi:hypothetical protein